MEQLELGLKAGEQRFRVRRNERCWSTILSSQFELDMPWKKKLAYDQLLFERQTRRLRREMSRPNEQRDSAFRVMILSVPRGKVSTYGAIAAAAGYPRYHRAVARLLRSDPIDRLPWHRIVGAGGEIKLRGAAAQEQQLRLRMEGVQFAGRRVIMERFEHSLRPWEVYP